MHRGYIHARTLASLNKSKYLLVRNPKATADDWLFLSVEYALADSQRGVDYCMARAKEIEQKAKGKRK
jgi:hypothetical protein